MIEQKKWGDLHIAPKSEILSKEAAATIDSKHGHIYLSRKIISAIENWDCTKFVQLGYSKENNAIVLKFLEEIDETNKKFAYKKNKTYLSCKSFLNFFGIKIAHSKSYRTMRYASCVEDVENLGSCVVIYLDKKIKN